MTNTLSNVTAQDSYIHTVRKLFFINLTEMLSVEVSGCSSNKYNSPVSQPNQ